MDIVGKGGKGKEKGRKREWMRRGKGKNIRNMLERQVRNMEKKEHEREREIEMISSFE